MKKIIAPFFLLLFFSIHSNFIQAQSDTQKHSVYFKIAKASLNSDAETDLTNLANSLASFVDYSINIEAHTDDQGDTDYNQKLAANRAASVKKFLLTKGIIVDNVITKSFGENNPQFSNEDEQGRQMNRRVDILVSTLAKTSFYEVKKDWQQDLEQIYTVDGNKKNQITGEKGTKIWIDEGSFVTKNGQIPSGEIEIKLTECYSFGDMLLADLTTISGDRILQTGGMLKIEAYAEGEELIVAKDKELLLATPTSSFDDEMKLFYGNEHAEEENVQDWDLTDSPVARNMKDILRFAKPPLRPIKPTQMTYFWDSTYMPQKPIAPATKRFRPITFPDTMVVIKKKFFASKRKVEEQRKAKVEKLVTRYEKRIKRRAYEEKSYATSMEKYKEKVKNYSSVLAEWEKEMEEMEEKYYASDKYLKTKELWDQIYEKGLEKHEKTMTEYKLYKRKKLQDYETAFEKTGAAVDAKFMAQYFTRANQSGWINLDKFSKIKDRELLVIKEDMATKESAVYAVFKESNSIIRILRQKNGVLAQQKFPRGEDVSIVAWKVENGQPMIASVDATVGSTSVVNLSYKKVQLRELREMMEGFN